MPFTYGMPIDFEIQLPIHLAGVEAASAPGVQEAPARGLVVQEEADFGHPFGAVRVILRVAAPDPVESAS
eukprot:3781143-Pyramimonas_sp.AAC.1